VRTSKSISNVLVWQLLGKFALQGITFFTAPFFTRLLSPSDYGSFSIYTTWVGFFTIIIGLQTHGAIANAKIKYSEEEFPKFLSSILSISTIFFAFVLALSIVFLNQFAALFAFSKFLVILLVIHSFTAFCYSFYFAVLIQEKKSKENAILSVIISIITTILAFIFVLNSPNNKALAKILATAIPSILFGIVFLIKIFLNGKTFFNKEYWTFCLALTLPLIFHSLGGIIFSQSDRVMLEKIIGLDSVGVYSVSYSLALVISIIWGACNTSWVPFYYEYKKTNNHKELHSKSNNYMIFYTIITLGFLLCAPEVFKILAPEKYWEGLKIIPLITLAYYFNFLYSFPANFEFYHLQTKLIAMSTILSAGINVGLNIVFIKRWGIMGAAVTTLISFIFLFIFHDIVARFVLRDKNYDYSWIFYLKGIIPVVVFSVLYYYLMPMAIFRWIIALVIGVFLLKRIVKTRSIF
jgi:O-antigen/teichoic acid export membrane protein